MTIARVLAAAFLVFALCGCEGFKNDPIIGDHPWQPSTFGMKPDKSDKTN
jgi:hypothetical protein